MGDERASVPEDSGYIPVVVIRMKILFIGDVFAKGGRKAVRHLLPGIVDQELVDLTIANVENISRGIGISRDAVRELKDAGIEVMTSGNHVWKRPGSEELLEREDFLLRPANYPPENAGRGCVVWEGHTGVKVGVVNLLGRVFMEAVDCPFHAVDPLLARLKQDGVRVVVVDFHGEATSEKGAFAWYVDGRVSAVIGMHTHVQTADERILPQGSGFITDIGMTGAQDSVIGVKVESSVKRFLAGVHQRLEPSSRNIGLHGVILDVCEETGKCQGIKRVRKVLDK